MRQYRVLKDIEVANPTDAKNPKLNRVFKPGDTFAESEVPEFALKMWQDMGSVAEVPDDKPAPKHAPKPQPQV